MSNEAVFEYVIRRAQEHARQNGLSIGQPVAHSSDDMTYCLISVDGDVATVEIPANKSRNGKKVEKKFPLNELFDPNVARDLVYQVN